MFFLLNISKKGLFLLMVILVALYIGGTLCIGPISEVWYITDITASAWAVNTHGMWIKDIVNYGFFISIIAIPLAILLSQRVRKQAEENNILFSKILKNSEQKEKFTQQFDKWYARSFGKFTKLAFYAGFLGIFLVELPSYWPYTNNLYFIIYLLGMWPLIMMYNGCFFFTILYSLIYAKVIRDICINEFEVDLFHPDRVGGMKHLGDFALLNAINLTIQAAIQILWWLMNNIAGWQDLQTILMTILFLFVGIIASFSAYYYPIRNIHTLLMRHRDKEYEKIRQIYTRNYKKLGQVDGAEETSVLNNLSLISGVEEKLKEFRDYPWDTGVITKLLSSYAIPIIAFVLQQMGLF